MRAACVLASVALGVVACAHEPPPVAAPALADAPPETASSPSPGGQPQAGATSGAASSSAGPAAPGPSPTSAPLVVAEPASTKAGPASWREPGSIALPHGGGPDVEQYARAFESERSGDLPAARRSYFELISKYPNSALVPYAYFAFGELFFQEAEQDPSKLALAAQAFMKVLSFPDPARARRESLARLVSIYERTGEKDKAESFRRTQQADAPRP
jgi:TolA-binding protein